MRTLPLLGSLLAPSPLWACATCFGANDNAPGLARGLVWGLFILLGATFGILGALTYAVAQIEKRRARRGC